MSHHNEIVQATGLHPFIAFIISVFVMGATQVLPEINTQWHIPAWIMESSQVIAWWCVGGTFIITVLNFMGINPFKKKGKK